MLITARREIVPFCQVRGYSLQFARRNLLKCSGALLRSLIGGLPLTLTTE
jgi:hypothetical protein